MRRILTHTKERGVESKVEMWIRRVAFSLALLLNAVCLLFWLEVICHDSYSSTLIWFIECLPYAACSLGVVLFVLLLLVLLFGRLYPAVLLGNAFFILAGMVQHFKITLRGDPLKITDLAMAREGIIAAQAFVGGGLEITEYMIQGFLLMVICVPALFLSARNTKIRFLRRIPACVALICAFAGYSNVLPSFKADVSVVWKDNLRRGLLVSFFDTKKTMNEPEGYGEETVCAELEMYQGDEEKPEILPHVLFVMSESLFDVSGDIQLSEDPLAYFKELQKEYWGGSFLSTVHGGGTASIEYEVLTGYRASDTNGRVYAADIGNIKPGMESLITEFKANGYYTQAIHPNSGEFYSRNTAYQILGFDSKLFIKSLEKPPKNVFPFPSDEYLFDQVIKAFENRPKDQPWFCYTITYQNHGGYNFKSDFSRIQVEEELEAEQKHNVNNFVNMLKLSDDALKNLIDYFDGIDEPVVVIVFGDHAPAVSLFGIDLPEDKKQRMAYHTTPILIYDNYDLDTSALPDVISSHRLGAKVLRLIGIDDDAYLNYVGSDDALNLTCFDGLIEENGSLIMDQQRYDDEAERLRLLHYDRIFGKNYGGEM